MVSQGLFDFGDVDGSQAMSDCNIMAITAALGRLFVADSYNHKVKQIDLQGSHCTTLVGDTPATLDEPGGITRAGDFLIVADTGNHRLRSVHIQTGEIRDFAAADHDHPPFNRVAIVFPAITPAANAVISPAASAFLRAGTSVVAFYMGYRTARIRCRNRPLVEGQDYRLLQQRGLRGLRNNKTFFWVPPGPSGRSIKPLKTFVRRENRTIGLGVPR